MDLDPEAARQINELIARIGALERLVADDVADRWGAARCAAWYEDISATNDAVPQTDELGRAYWATAIDRLWPAAATVFQPGASACHAR